MGQLIPLLVGVVFGIVLTMLMRRRAESRRRDLTAPPPLLRPDPRPHAERQAQRPVGDDELANLVRQGRKIEAIKWLRDDTGISLSEAKEIVDAIERDQR